MKKVGVVVAALALVAGVAVAATNVVTSVNMVGFTKVTCPDNKFILVSQQFNSLNGAALKSADVFGDQLPLGTIVYYYDASLPTPGYVSDAYTEDGWETSITYEGGMGFWILTPGGSGDVDVYFMGEVPTVASVTNTIYNGFTMLGYPYSASKAWGDTGLAQGGGLGDVVYFWDPTIPPVGNYVSFANTEDGWEGADYLVSPTAGFWYLTSASQYDFTEARPYNP